MTAAVSIIINTFTSASLSQETSNDLPAAFVLHTGEEFFFSVLESHPDTDTVKTPVTCHNTVLLWVKQCAASFVCGAVLLLFPTHLN